VEQKKEGGETPTIASQIKQKPKLVMVPLFSWRNIIVIVIGLVLGIFLAFGYWLLSPSIGSSATSSSTTEGNGGASAGLLGMLGMEPEGPYESQIRIQVVSPGSEYIPLRNLQQMGEYYSAKAHSLPFLEYLNQKLTEQMPEFTYDTDNLSQMITTRYDTKSELPIIVVSVVAPTEREAVGLAGLIPEDFRNYLTYEENDQRQKEYDYTIKEINSVKTALYEAQKELNEFQPQAALDTNPDYLSLKSKVDTLQQLLDSQAAQLVNQNWGNTDLQAQYDDAVQQMKSVSAKLAAAQQELQTLGQGENSATNTITKITLSAKIKALQSELDKLMSGSPESLGLAEIISSGNTTSAEYTNILTKIEMTSKALAAAQQEYDDLMKQTSQTSTVSTEYGIAQIKVDILNTQLTALQNKTRQLYQQILTTDEDNNQTDVQSVFEATSAALAEAKKELSDLENQLGYNRLAADLDYKVAQDKVNNLNTRLETLVQQLGPQIDDNTGSAQETEYLIAGNASPAFPILPARSRASKTLLTGAIVGVIVAWGALNYKWLYKKIVSSGASKPEGEE
jgi:hypothetical protein